jgi:hypothetical protein
LSNSHSAATAITSPRAPIEAAGEASGLMIYPGRVSATTSPRSQ